MIATSHVIIGGAAGVAVGTITQNPAAALAAGIVSHLLCDYLPHLDGPPNIQLRPDGEVIWDKTLYIFAITDSLIAMGSVLGLWHFLDHWSISSMFAWGAGGGYLPDLLDNFPLWRDQAHTLPGLKQFHKFHMWIHNWRFKYPMPKHWKLGIITQIVTVVPCLYYLIK